MISSDGNVLGEYLDNSQVSFRIFCTIKWYRIFIKSLQKLVEISRNGNWVAHSISLRNRWSRNVAWKGEGVNQQCISTAWRWRESWLWSCSRCVKELIMSMLTVDFALCIAQWVRERKKDGGGSWMSGGASNWWKLIIKRRAHRILSVSGIQKEFLVNQSWRSCFLVDSYIIGPTFQIGSTWWCN